MKKNLIVKQDGFKECGAASLLSIIRYYGGNISINKLVEMTNTDKSGSNFYMLKESAYQVALEAIGYKVDNINNLLSLNIPFICQLINNNYEHFVVVYSIKKNKVIMMDPAVGEKVITCDEFKKLWTGYIMIFKPFKKLVFYQDKKYLNKIIIETLVSNKGIVITILFCSIIFTLTSIIYALYFQVVLEYVLGTEIHNLIVLTFFFASLLLIKCISSFFRNELLIFFNQKLDCSIFLNIFKKILLLPFSFYKNKTTGEITSRINDLMYVKNIINKIIITVFLDIILIILSSIILVSINPLLFILLIIIMIIYLIILYIFRPILKNYIDKYQNNNSLIESYLIESINGFETIKNMSNEDNVMYKMENL